MIQLRRLTTLACYLSLGGLLPLSVNCADEFERPVYQVLRTSRPLKIDGCLDEADWKSATEIRDFHFPWHTTGKKETTSAKMLWDDQYLYLGHICDDAWITARCQEHDGPVAKDDCFEVMVAPNVDKPNVYFNIEWNVLGAWVDNHRPNGPRQPRAPKWDATGVRIVGRFLGTLNNDRDRDQWWMAEVAIPLTNFSAVAKNTPPKTGDSWYLNLNRHGGDTNLQYSQWSPADTPRPSFHTPHRFGRILFVDRGVAKKR